MQAMANTNQAIPLKIDATHGGLSPTTLKSQANPALRRLGDAVADRNVVTDVTNYSRTHHRHARSHTRK
jgi:hypothetical protein